MSIGLMLHHSDFMAILLMAGRPLELAADPTIHFILEEQARVSALLRRLQLAHFTSSMLVAEQGSVESSNGLRDCGHDYL